MTFNLLKYLGLFNRLTSTKPAETIESVTFSLVKGSFPKKSVPRSTF